MVLRSLAGLLVGGGLAVLVTSVLLRGRRDDIALEELLDLPYGDSDVDVAEVVRTTGIGERAVMLASQMVEQIDTKGAVRNLMERARVPLRTGEYVAIVAGGGVLAGAAMWLLSGQWLAGFVAFVAAPFVGRAWLGFRISRRLRRFDDDLPETISLIASSMSAGHTFARAIQMASAESEGPVAEELQRVVQESQLGQSVVESLARLRDRIPLESVELLYDAIRVQASVGGSLTDLLHGLADFIRARHELKREIRVLTAEGRTSATVLGLVPLGLLLFIGSTDGNYIEPLFEGSGLLWLFGSAALVLVGVAWIRKLADVEF